jgi:protease-4
MTRRVATSAFLLALFGLIIAAMVGAARDSGASGGAVLESADRTFSGSSLEEGNAASVAIVPIEGTIVNGDSGAAGGQTGGDDTVALIDEIRKSGDYAGIILEVNSPGGAVLASAEIAEALQAAQDDGIKVVSWMRDTGASGGYYVSTPADTIVAAPSTVTGSIGVILHYATVEELAKKIGVKPVTIKSGELKDIGSPYRDLTKEERTVLQTMIDEAYGDFVTAVSEGRGISESKVREIADGRIYTGRQAVENGLVDELGTREVAYDAMADLLDVDSGDLDIIRFDRSYGFAELLTASSSESLGAAETARLAGEVLGSVISGDSVSLAGARAAGTPFIDLEYRATL